MLSCDPRGRTPLGAEIVCSLEFSLASSLLLIVPFTAVLVGRQRVLPWLLKGKTILLNRGELVLGSVSLLLGGYLGWQGITALI